MEHVFHRMDTLPLTETALLKLRWHMYLLFCNSNANDHYWTI